MRRERVSDDIYVFTSSLFAQVTASAVVTKEGIVVIDTLPFPQETQDMLDYLADLGQGPIKYLVNTHWHGDHTNGNFLFDESVELVCHKRCLLAMQEFGEPALRESQESTPLLDGVEMRFPNVVFDSGQMVLHVGDKSVEMALSPGHTLDSIVAYVREDKVMIAADTIMPVPYFVAGSRHDFKNSLEALKEYNLESIVQGHGEVLLRGEIPKAIESSLKYLDVLEQKVTDVVEKGQGPEALKKISIERCGKSRIPLNGLVQELHLANAMMLYDELTGGS